MLSVLCAQIMYAQRMGAVSHVDAFCTYLSKTLFSLVPYSIVRLTNINNVNEYLLSFCQSNVSNQLLGSNACTIIAVLASINFLSGTAWFSQHTLISTLDSSFLGYCHQLFIEGNQMYESLNEDTEILEHPSLGFKDIAERGDEYHFNNFFDFLLELQTLSSSNGKIALVLFNPDKSMTLLINEVNQSILIESNLEQLQPVVAPGGARGGKCPPQIIFCPPPFCPPPQFLIISVETISC